MEGEQDPVPVKTFLIFIVFYMPSETTSPSPSGEESSGTSIYGTLGNMYIIHPSIQTFPVGYSLVSKLRQGKNTHEKEIERSRGRHCPMNHFTGAELG